MQEVGKVSDPVLWDLLTFENTVENDAATETYWDKSIKGNLQGKAKEKESGTLSNSHT